MKISNKTDVGLPLGGSGKSSSQVVKKEDVPARLSLQNLLKPFTGDLRGFGVTERLKELFDAAKLAAEAGRILPRGSFLNISI